MTGKNNSMRKIRIEKVTVNMGVGEPGEKMQKAMKILEKITNAKTVKTKATVKLPTWNIRPGLEIGLKTTLRGKLAQDFLKKALQTKDNTIKPRQFDRLGNFGFGIHEYIEIPGTKYDPSLGIRGLDVLVTFERPGYRLKKRKVKRTKIGKSHIITKQECMQYVQDIFGTKITQE